jgi:hypothetical protein
MHYASFHRMTLKLQYPLTNLCSTPSTWKSTFVIRVLVFREQICYIVFENIVMVKKVLHQLKSVSFKEYQTSKPQQIFLR